MAHATNLESRSGPTWLRELLVEAVEMNVCVRRGCTTCGATSFRNAVWNSAGGPPTYAEARRCVADQLGTIETIVSPEAVRHLVMELHTRAGPEEFVGLLARFDASEAGAEYRRMLEHDVRRREDAATAEGVIELRRTDKQARAAAHANRKVERDRDRKNDRPQ
ncbi:MAG: hypothetical protein KF777_24470 [Planctomycetaceae bacterium]|nr:hypothetical protein [Planctomycetaceae bacterium]